MKMIEINNYKDLRNFIITNDLTTEQINKIINQTLGVFVIDIYTKCELILKLDEFYINFIKDKSIIERPLFLMG